MRQKRLKKPFERIKRENKMPFSAKGLDFFGGGYNKEKVYFSVIFKASQYERRYRMKKLLILFLCTFVILSITACEVFTEREAEVGFIDEALLSDFRVADFPIPTGDVRHIDDKAYVNMTDVEYGNYADEVMAYLLSKDDIYHKGYHYETGFAGGIFFIPEYRFSQLREDTDSSVGWFIFSLTEALNEGDEYNRSYWNGVFVKVYRDSGSFGSFEYNTVIEICESYCAVRGVASHNEHTYEYVGNDYTHQKVYTCGCATPDIAEMHYDYDKDNYCDACLNEHKHVYTPWYNNETYHWNVGDCLWNACDLGTYAQHCDEDKDGVCDVCGCVNSNYAKLIDAYRQQNSGDDSVSVENYYGEYSGGAIVAMIASGGYDDAIWEETVGEITIRYYNGNRILVLYEGEFYTLTDAYNNGYITAEDLTDIAAKHMEFHPYLFE